MKKEIWIINHNAIPPSMGALVRHTYFARYLNEKGYTTKIFTASKIHNTKINMINDRSLFLEKTIDGAEYTFIKTCDYENNGYKRIKNMFEFTHNVKKAVKYFSKPDIIYASSPDIFTPVAAIRIAKKYRIPCITEIRDLWPESLIGYNKNSKFNPIIKVMYRLEKWVYKKSNALIFTMEGGKDYIINKGWDREIDLNKITHINNGADLEEYYYNKNHHTFKDDDLDNNNTFKIIYTGSIRKANNLSKIVDAAKYIQENKIADVVFLIYGDGNEKQALQERCEKDNINNIKFKGRVEKKYIPYILSKADANLLHWEQTNATYYGSSGNKLFDYLASGKPIISTIVSNYDIIEKHNVGMNCKNQTPQEIADTVFAIYSLTDEQYNSMCDNAINVSKNFDYRVLTNNLIDIIENIKQ